jgi:transposase
LFEEGEFFDPRDLVQVKYEMLRRVRVDGRPVSQAASDFGVSRPTFYEAQAAFSEGGITALLPKKRGPRGRHKLRGEVLAFLHKQIVAGEPMRAAELARQVQKRFGLSVHPRSIERALRDSEKKTR